MILHTARRVLAITALAAAAHAHAAPVAAPAPHLVDGFRSAHFGMTEDDVRAAIARDFHPADGDVTAFDNPIERTHVVALHLAALEPAPGAVNITYILGAASHRLMHVNVVWTTGPAPTSQERARMADGGAQLAAYFRGLGWPRGATTASVAPDAAWAVVFAGVDPKQEAVEVRLTGVKIRLKNGTEPAPSGPATLRVAYYATTGVADVAAVAPGSF